MSTLSHIVPSLSQELQPGPSGLNNFMSSPRDGSFMDKTGEITEKLLDLNPMESELSNVEKPTRNQFLVPVKSRCDTALYTNSHKSNDNESHLVLMLREELKSVVKDQYNALKESRSHETNKEIEALEMEMQKLKSQTIANHTITGPIPSPLQPADPSPLQPAEHEVYSTSIPSTFQASPNHTLT